MIDIQMVPILIGIAIVTGAFAGTLAGLLGVGGGIVIVPALYFALQFTGGDPALSMQVAVGTSLATIIVTAISSSWGHFRRGALDFALLRRWAPFVLFGVVGGAFLGGAVNGKVLVAVFACVAAIVAIDMVFRNPKSSPEPRSASGPLWALLGILAGGISAMMGIGGGTVGVPLLSILGYDIRRAVGTSAALGFIIALPACIIYIATGLGREGLPPFSLGYVNIVAALVIIPLTTVFAQLGVRIAHSISYRALRLCFGFFLAITAVRMFLDLVP
ncbi:sulfite exporter TauE/SafE family protein [Cucumibacter marinus]|uniref:sulfite exporter TauE/SafE family protein n=1 Tax=Cucumibacter marinus TaxID=1121252 RepID=UPI0004272E75|nr:sulfite exporter TauE/SafE family protein [Cucumibacter marinus]